jgi:ribosomal protein S18 acetylase RimI-like enzyme
MLEIITLKAGDEAVLDSVAEEVFDLPPTRALAAAFLSDPHHHICVGVQDGVVVGFASAVHYRHPDKPDELWIDEVGVTPTYQKRGLGKALLRCLLEIGRDLGCAEAWVLTDEDNRAARALYRSGGGEESLGVVMVSFPLEGGE